MHILQECKGGGKGHNKMINVKMMEVCKANTL